MQYRKKIIGATLGVIVMNVLIPIVLSACKKDKPSREQHSSNLECYTIYKNFVIEKIHMSRVTIEGVPANKHTLFLLKTCIAGCNPERKVRRKGLEGPWIWSFEDGLADTIYCIEFKTKANKMVSPHPLNWNGKIGESCILSLSEAGDEKRKRAFYEGDIRNLPYDITYPCRLWIYATHFIEDGYNAKDTLIYLFSFHEKRALPDSVIFVLQGTSIKAPIDYSSKAEYHLIWRSDFMGHSKSPKAELEAMIKEIQMKRQKEFLSRKKQKNQKDKIQ